MVKEIGWLVLNDKAIGRQYTGKQNKAEVFAEQKEFGARVIMAQLSERYKINYVSVKQLYLYPYTFFSCVSWYDFYSLVVALKNITPKTRLVIGGPGVGNIEHIADKVYASVFGRCDYDPQEIIDSNVRDNIAYGMTEHVSIGQPLLLHDKAAEGQEKSYGCLKKCYFCEYGWRYKHLSGDAGNKYQSGPAIEDFIKHADFSKKRRVVTGLDGLTEKERACVNKKLSHQELIDTLLRTDDAGAHVVLKLYSVVGLPCGNKLDDFAEVRDAIAQAGAKKKQSLTVVFYTSHFVPMPCTPMEQERVIVNSTPKISPEQYGKIKLMTYLQGTGAASAALETALYRATGKEIGIFRQSLASDKFLRLPGRDRVLAIKQLLPGILDEHAEPMPWLTRTFKLEKHKEKYYNFKRGL